MKQRAVLSSDFFFFFYKTSSFRIFSLPGKSSLWFHEIVLQLPRVLFRKLVGPQFCVIHESHNTNEVFPLYSHLLSVHLLFPFFIVTTLILS